MKFSIFTLRMLTPVWKEYLTWSCRCDQIRPLSGKHRGNPKYGTKGASRHVQANSSKSHARLRPVIDFSCGEVLYWE